jgi:DNA-binding Xre family transcriptional regulator
MTIILGEVIRRRIRDDKRSAQDICDALGMSRGNLDKIYKKDSINTDLLARLCVLLEFDFFDYVNPFKMAGAEVGPKLHGVQEDFSEYRTPLTRLQKCLGELYDSQKELDMLEKEVVMLRAHLIDKDHIIALLTDKIESLRKPPHEPRSLPPSQD